MKNFILKLVVLFGFLFLPTIVKAQTFIITDIDFPSSISQTIQQREKDNSLGEEIKLEFFDKSVRVIISGRNGEKENGIFDKVGDNKYELTDKRGGKMILELNTLLGYIKSIKLYSQGNTRYDGTIIIAKRK